MKRLWNEYVETFERIERRREELKKELRSARGEEAKLLEKRIILLTKEMCEIDITLNEMKRYLR